MGEFSQIDLPNLTRGGLQITGITARVKNTNHENVQVALNQAKNSLGVVVSNTSIEMHINWRYSVSVLTVSGTGDIRGTIGKIDMKLGFDTQKSGEHLVPKLNVQDFNVTLDANSFVFNFDCTLCPRDVLNFILTAFRGPLLDEVKDQARSVVNSEVVNVANRMILANYPTSIQLNEQLSISTAITGPLSVKTDYLSGSIDGTVFLTSKGYDGNSNATQITVEDSCAPGEVCLFLGKHVFETATRSMNQFPLQFSTTYLGMDVLVDIDGTKVPVGVELRENNLFLLGGATITIPGIAAVIELGGTSLIDFSIKSGDKTNMAYVTPVADRSSLELETLAVTVFGFRANLGIFASLVDSFVTSSLSAIVFETIPVPKIAIMPLTASSGQTRFNETYAHAGISFSLGESA
jgi:hypothetical protein